jgi:TIR domain-containing protein
MIDLWSDTKIIPGANWREEIKRAIETASVGVLLVSADFLASQFIAEDELPPLLKAAETRGTVILSVILSPCGFDFSPLSQFQAANDPSKPLTKMSSHQKEELWNEVAKIIRDAIKASNFTRDDSSYEAESNEYAEHKRLFHVSYGPLPSKATVKCCFRYVPPTLRGRTDDQAMTTILNQLNREVLARVRARGRCIPNGAWGFCHSPVLH